MAYGHTRGRRPSVASAFWRCQVESTLCVRTDRPAILKSRVSDSARPTDRPAARSAAKQIWGSEHPTDRPSLQAAQPFVPTRAARPTDPSPGQPWQFVSERARVACVVEKSYKFVGGVKTHQAVEPQPVCARCSFVGRAARTSRAGPRLRPPHHLAQHHGASAARAPRRRVRGDCGTFVYKLESNLFRTL